MKIMRIYVYSVDYLEQIQQENNELWHFSRKEDLCKDLGQIIELKPDYEWDVHKICTQKMKLENHTTIIEAVKQA